MTEKEIRDILRELCNELDASARKAVRTGLRRVVMPTALGAGLAIGCFDSKPVYGVPVPDADVADVAPAPLYGVPDADAATTDATTSPDAEANPDLDAGPVPEYMAPDVDAGPMPPYMAPDLDAGPVPDYMAPDLDAGNNPDADPGPAPLYMPAFSPPE